MNEWWWIDAGVALWWFFTAVTGLLALLLVMTNLRLWWERDPHQNG